MESLYDRSAPKKATNLSINRDLLRQARDLKINLSQTFEHHLAEVVAERLREQWREENRPAIEDYNRRIAKRGVFSEGLRRF
jgi:antitoxin CcdA